MNIEKNDIDIFFKVLDFLEKSQEKKGIYIYQHLMRTELRTMKYIGIGEGVDFDEMLDDDKALLKEYLLKESLL